MLKPAELQRNRGLEPAPPHFVAVHLALKLVQLPLDDIETVLLAP